MAYYLSSGKEASVANEKVVKIIQNQIDLIATEIENISKGQQALPALLSLQRDAEARKFAAETAPDGFWDEYPIIYNYEVYEEARVRGLVRYQAPPLSYYSDTSGSASAYLGVVSEAVKSNHLNGVWGDPIISNFQSFYDGKEKEGTLPIKLNRIHPDLGEVFSVGLKSYEKALVHSINVNQAAGDMRNFLQQLWGHLLEMARNKAGKKLTDHVWKKEKYRIEVAEILSPDETSKSLLIGNLAKIYNQYSQLSDSNLTKNNLAKDIELLKEIKTEWFSVIDSTVSLMIEWGNC